MPPETLLKALLLQALYSIRSERHGLLRTFFDRIVEDAYLEQWASEDHFTVDGTLIESYASMKSVRSVGSEDRRVSDGADDDDPGNPTVSFHGERRTNRTHRSITDPEARLMRKAPGQQTRLSHSAHALMENRSGLLIDLSVAEANGTAERREALRLLRRAKRRHRLGARTLAADKGYDAGDFLHRLETEDGVVPLVPILRGEIKSRTPEADARRRAHRRRRTKRYAAAQRVRKRVEEIYGWAKEIGGLRRARHVGRWKIDQHALVTGAAYNLLRLGRLESTCA